MTSKQQPTDKPDFSNYAWFPGVREPFNSLSISTHENRVFLGIKGYDKKHNAHGYIQAEFSPETLRQIRDRINKLLARAAKAAKAA